MPNKLIELDISFTKKASDADSSVITIEGYANTTDKDRSGDVVESEAWTKGGLDNYRKNPIVLAYHDRRRPIGMTTSLGVDDKGLKIVADIHKAAGEVYDLVKDGVLKTFSVGFMIKDAIYDSAAETFFIKDLELHEISVVSIPANQNSVFSVSKSLDNNDMDELKKLYEKENVLPDNKPKDSSVDIEKSIESILESKLKELESKLKEEKAVPKSVPSEENKIAELEASLKALTDKIEAEKEQELEKARKEKAEREKAEAEAIKKEKEELAAKLEEKEAEFKALKEGKMNFGNSNSSVSFSDEEKDISVLTAKILGKPIDQVSIAKEYITKVGAHLTGTTADWETEFSQRVQNDIRQRLLVEPLFNTIQMNAAAMNIPVNPEAGVGLWVPTGDFSGANSTGNSAQTHGIIDNQLVAHKVAAKEYIGYEEEEDAIIPLVPIIREAIVRRMARTTEIAILRGTGTNGAQPNHDPIAGLTDIANTAGNVDTLSIGAAATVTVSDLAAIREKLSLWALNPSDVVYIVSTEAYFDLMKDPDFRTMDVVGNNATILRGQVSQVNGSPVIVSAEFEAKAANKYAVVAVNKANFLVGNLRGLMMERDKNIEEQKNVIVTTRRMGFLDLITGKGVAAIKWVA